MHTVAALCLPVCLCLLLFEIPPCFVFLLCCLSFVPVLSLFHPCFIFISLDCFSMFTLVSNWCALLLVSCSSLVFAPFFFFSPLLFFPIFLRYFGSFAFVFVPVSFFVWR